MHIKGRHVTQDIAGIAPAHHDIQGIGKQMKLVSEVKPNGVIRVDDENHPEFWLEIQLSDEDLKVLGKKED